MENKKHIGNDRRTENADGTGSEESAGSGGGDGGDGGEGMAGSVENPVSAKNKKVVEREKAVETGEVFENILMRFCREQKKYTPKEVALQLGVSLEMYRKMEKGDLLITRQQAGQLGRIYGSSSVHFYREAVQLDLLLTRMAIIKILKGENDLLIQKVKKGQDSK